MTLDYMTANLRVLLLQYSAEDVDLITDHLTRGGTGVLVKWVGSIEQLTEALGTFAPHVVLADHDPESADAGAALQTLRASRPATPLIVVANSFDERTAAATLRAGAEDFVVKSNLGRLRSAIESAIRVRQPLEKLSPRQLEVLRMVAEGHTTRAIAFKLNLSAKTVDTHRGEVMKRIGIHDVVGLVRYAVRVGLVTAES
jgi:DNA-binding NarL/FixJ family response regulator